MTTYHDLTHELTDNTPVFPGDPELKVEQLCTVSESCAYVLRHLHFGNHAGTHIDFPIHVKPDGKNSSDYGLDKLIGTGLIVEVPPDTKIIDDKFIATLEIRPDDIVFFKTQNSTDHLLENHDVADSYVCLNESAAKALVACKAKIVGVDYISIEACSSKNLVVHNTLLANDILIVESLKLWDIAPGRYKLFILPLNIPHMDGLPARVIAETTG